MESFHFHSDIGSCIIHFSENRQIMVLYFLMKSHLFHFGLDLASHHLMKFRQISLHFMNIQLLAEISPHEISLHFGYFSLNLSVLPLNATRSP